MKKKLKLYVYDYIKSHERLPSNMIPSKVFYYTKPLREEGYIKKLGCSGIWKVTSKDRNLLQKKATLTGGIGRRNEVRSHGYRFKIGLAYLDGWNRREKLFKRYKIPFKPVPYGQSIKVRRHTVTLYDSTITIVFYSGKSFKVYSGKEGDARALLEVKLTLESLENRIKTNLKFGQSWKLQCYGKHHALVRNSLAKWHLSRGIKKFSIKDFDGKEWLLMDNSFNLEELECTAPTKATKDLDVVVAPFMNKLRANPHILDKHDSDITKFTNELKAILELSRVQTGIITELQKQNVVLTTAVFNKN